MKYVWTIISVWALFVVLPSCLSVIDIEKASSGPEPQYNSFGLQDTLNVNLRSFHKGDRFRVVYRQHIFDTTRAWIEVDFLQVLRDKRTGAEFLWYESGGKAGFCQIIINEKEKER